MSNTLGRGQLFPLENYKRGARIWHRHHDLVWIGGELDEDVSFSTQSIRLRLDNEQTITLPITCFDDLPFLRNPSILQGAADLTTLSYLHEPAVLHNLRHRFEERQIIYTYCGIVLVAINPFADCDQLYDDNVISLYRGSNVRDLDPHIYGVAEEAYFDMSEFGKCQSVIVSGESGAGKTVSCRKTLRYLTSIAGVKSGNEGVDAMILASNPIMESFGNAKTTRNDNSSRFGKYIQINFDNSLKICGANMKTYLLEKSRVVFQAPEERNYHIFYQICWNSSHPFLSEFQLGDCGQFWYTMQGDSAEVDTVDDNAEFAATVEAMKVLGMSEQQQRDVFRVLAGILYLGNVEFSEGEEQAEIWTDANSIVKRVCEEVLGIDEQQLRMWLRNREIRTNTEVIRKGLDRTEAVRARDAIAKLLYSQLFSWIVKTINDGFQQNRSKGPSNRFIGVLDIYGFETFKTNSFEQFCINYANEKLQNQFNHYVFKLEQQEYVREEISWVQIEFCDNQPTIDLIEGRPGLIDYLDEQCKMVRGTDDGWLNQLTSCATLKKNPQLTMPRIRCHQFIVKHFAADVSYSIDGFLEKNKDTVSEQLLETFTKSKCKFVVSLVSSLAVDSQQNSLKRKKTVAAQFRDSLKDLMESLYATRPHYVRCIKPNDTKSSFTFEPKRAIQQLRACGVLETVRLSAAGFPSRWMYADFARRYRILYTEQLALWRDKPKAFAEKACQKWLETDKFALGKTKIFFRTGQVAMLERVRIETLGAAATKIQSRWRGFVARRRYENYRRSLLLVQASLRAFLLYRRTKFLQMHRAAITIQTNVRGFLARKRYERSRSAILAIQSHYRASLVRKQVAKLRYEKSVLLLQRWLRGCRVRREQRERLRKIVKVQCCVRRWLARRRLRELKIEARSVGHLQKLNTGLENKIIELQIKLDQSTSERNRLSSVESTVDLLRMQLSRAETEKKDLARMKEKAEELEARVEQLETEVDVKSAQLAEVDNRMVTLKNKSEKAKIDAENRIAQLTEALDRAEKSEQDYEEENKRLQRTVATESEKRIAAENEATLMREQLFQNANLLASPALSRVGSIRKDVANSGANSATRSDTDVGLLLKQQRMANELRMRLEQSQRECERLKLVIESDNLRETLDKRTSLRAFESQRLQDLEFSYTRLKSELEHLLEEKVERGLEHVDIKALMDKIIEENDRRREESVELRALLSTRMDRKSNADGSPTPLDSGHWSSAHSDDDYAASGELDDELCLERQCRQLKAFAEHAMTLVTQRNEEIGKLEKRLEEFTEPLFRDSMDSRDVNGQVGHLVTENMALNDKWLRQCDELIEVRAQLRGLSVEAPADSSDTLRLETSNEATSHNGQLKIFNVPEFARIIICDLKPRVARVLTKTLPAYLVLAAFRYHDAQQDDGSLAALFSAIHAVLKDKISRSTDLDILSLWLVNSWRLSNLLRQFDAASSDEIKSCNSAAQNEQLITLDLDSIRTQLAYRVDEAYETMMKKTIEPVISSKIVAAVLLHDSTNSSSTNGHATLNRQSSKDSSRNAFEDLIDFLEVVYNKLEAFGADRELLSQVFGQLARWISSLAMNTWMFRSDLCTFERAISIKHNVTKLDDWFAKRGFPKHGDYLEPLIQTCHLLQSRKDEGNIETLCGEMTSRLRPKQVVSILQHYRPGEFFEELPIGADFLVQVMRKLQERDSASGISQDDQNTLLENGTYLVPLERVFVPTECSLESLSLPSCLQLSNVCKLV